MMLLVRPPGMPVLRTVGMDTASAAASLFPSYVQMMDCSFGFEASFAKYAQHMYFCLPDYDFNLYKW